MDKRDLGVTGAELMGGKGNQVDMGEELCISDPSNYTDRVLLRKPHVAGLA